MQIKEGASLQGLQIEMRPVLKAADAVWKENGQELVVTAGTDGTHSAGSLHYYGRAIDLRTRYFSDEERELVFNSLKSILPDSLYDVINHSTHIHVEYDPK
jgi:hypothetical protein